MSKTIINIIEDKQDKFVITVNEEKKRFHFLSIGDKYSEISKIISKGKKKVRDYEDAGYMLVAFEDVFDHMDKFEVYDADGKLQERGLMDCSDNDVFGTITTDN